MMGRVILSQLLTLFSNLCFLEALQQLDGRNKFLFVVRRCWERALTLDCAVTPHKSVT
jgi:hypothetical protein